MKKILLVMMLCTAAMLYASNVEYTADDVRIFRNPERGFITMLTSHLSEEKPYGVKGEEETLDKHIAKDSISLVLVHYYLDNYRETQTLPSKVINAFDEDMQVLREKGLKAIIRFSYVKDPYYDKKTKKYSAKDATLEIAQRHIGQYMSHWQNNADVIFVFQAGIIGAWGEWYYTDNYGNEGKEMNDKRRALVDTLLAAVPADRCIQLRTPLFKTSYADDMNSPLTVTEAYQNTPKARLAHHNDAFLYGADNQGTYQDTAMQKPYLAQETLFVPIGGESDITDEEQAQTDASYARTTAEMSRLHWTFIQSGYSYTVTDMWRENGTFDELNRKLGYRYQLVNGAFSDEVGTGSKMSVSLRIRNAGYAPLYNARPAYIVLKSNQHSAISIQMETDPRSWLPNGVVTNIYEQVTIPENVPSGTYHLYLYLPDAYATLADDPRYAVRFANEDVWDAETGMNDLHAEVTVVEGETPDPPQPPVEDDAVVLPAVLNKSNAAAWSYDMTWYNGNWFDFGPEDAENTGRWAEWKVALRYPGEYIVSENMAAGNGTGHAWQLQLLKEGLPVRSYSTEDTWHEGMITYKAKWDLTNVAKDTYTLRVQNGMEWGQPKLEYLMLQYDGELPTGVETATSEGMRPYKILENGILYIVQSDGKKYYCF